MGRHGTPRKRRQSEPADMGKHVQHPRALRQPRGKGMVRTLVEEQPCLLPAHQIGHIGGPVHPDGHRRCRRIAQQHGIHIVQPFQTAPAAPGVLEDRGHACHLGQGRSKLRQKHIRPGRVGLHHGDVAEPVDDHTGQTVRLGMDQPVEGGLEQPLPQGKRLAQPRREPRLIRRAGLGTIQNTADDLGIRVHRHQRHRAALGILEHGDRARCHRTGAAVGDDLVGVNPRIAAPDGLRFRLGQEAQNRQRGRCHTAPFTPLAPKGKAVFSAQRSLIACKRPRLAVTWPPGSVSSSTKTRDRCAMMRAF